MTYKIEWIEVNKYGEQKVSLTRPDGSKLLEAKLGKEFKSQNITAGQTIEGNEWKSPKNGSIYIFPVKEEEPTAYQYKPVYPPRSPSQSHPAMEYQKEVTKNVEKAQDNTSHSVRVSSTMRDAVLLAIAQEDPSHENVLEQRKWLWKHWSDPDDDPIYGD